MRTQLRGDVHAPAAARHFVMTGLRGAVASSQPALCDDLALIVSELVTNSVRASAQVVDVELRVEPDRVEIQVTDDASGWPTLRAAEVDSVDGRGLDIVDQLADSWRTVSRRTGKSVIATCLRNPS
jgi:anti-sigma regulatory factor (Ser/Thr protein kinase)